MVRHFHSLISLDIENQVFDDWLVLAVFDVEKSLDRDRIPDPDLFLEMSLLKMNKGALSMLAGLMKQTFWGWHLTGHCCLLGRLPMSHGRVGRYLPGWHLMGHSRY
jgi:hypothetical protein